MQQNLTEWDEDIVSTPEEDYQAFLRGLLWHDGFAIEFVRCSSASGQDLIEKIKRDLPQKKVDVLTLSEPIDNLIKIVQSLPNHSELDVLFVVGLDKSLTDYIRTGYGGQGEYYNLDTVPPILSHLNWQRENFRDRFPNLCFVFLLPKFAIKYIIRRAPDFFDWRSGVFDISKHKDSSESTEIKPVFIWTRPQSQWTPQTRDIQVSSRLQQLYSTFIFRSIETIKNSLQSKYYKSGNNDNSQALNYTGLRYNLDPSQTWKNLGNALFNLGRYEESIIAYDQAIPIKPNYYETGERLSDGKRRLGRGRKNVLMIYGVGGVGKSALAAYLYHDYNQYIPSVNLGMSEELIATYDKGISIKPDHEAWNNRGVALFNLGRYEEAIDSYNKALEIDSDAQSVWLNRSITLRNLGRYTEAVISCEQALKINPDNLEVWHEKGYCFEKLGQYEESLQCHNHTIRIKSDYVEGWYNRGVQLGNLGRYEEAISSYDKALEINPYFHKAWNNRGGTLSNLGRYEEAIYSYNKALEIKPDYPQAWNNRGVALGNIGKYEEAILSYDTIKFDYYEAWSNRGITLSNLGRYEEAISSYDKAIEIKSSDPSAYYNKACAYSLQKQIKLALENLQKAIQLNPEKYREMAKTDSDFDNIRHNPRFQALIQ